MGGQRPHPRARRAPIEVGADHVLGISPRRRRWPSSTVREPFGRALDLGTGCGVQALHLAEHVRDVVATDVNERALAMTRLNAGLNEVDASTCARAACSSRSPASGSTWSSPTRRS